MSTEADRKPFNKSKSASRLQLNINTPRSPSNILSGQFLSPRSMKSPSGFGPLNYKPLSINRPKTPGSSDSSKSTSPIKSSKRSVFQIKELKSNLQSVNRIQRELDNAQIQLVEVQNKLLKSEMGVDALKNELKTKEKENGMLLYKLQECTRKLEETMTHMNELDEEISKERKVNQALSIQLKELGVSGQVCQCDDLRKENMDLRSKLYRLLQRYKEISQRCEKLETSSVDIRAAKVSNDELLTLEKQFREVEEYQVKLLNENAGLKAQLSQASFSRFERLLKLSNRLYKLNHEMSQLLIFLKAFQSGEGITLTTLLGLQTTPKKPDADADVIQLCDNEIDQMASTLEQFRAKFTELLTVV
mmetsp:Transcript_33368/g.58515  ORF Transcript_33368/g.58515 Transcript_33368/m.58515 type:complete len:361 (-) Transcript_33368:30-1112(-)